MEKITADLRTLEEQGIGLQKIPRATQDKIRRGQPIKLATLIRHVDSLKKLSENCLDLSYPQLLRWDTKASQELGTVRTDLENALTVLTGTIKRLDASMDFDFNSNLSFATQTI